MGERWAYIKMHVRVPTPYTVRGVKFQSQKGQMDDILRVRAPTYDFIIMGANATLHPDCIGRCRYWWGRLQRYFIGDEIERTKYLDA